MPAKRGTYRGAYPDRVHTVWTAKVEGKHVAFVTTNDRRVFTCVPKVVPARLPKPLEFLSRLETEFTFTEVTNHG